MDLPSSYHRYYGQNVNYYLAEERKVAKIMTIGSQVVGPDVVEKLWPAYFESLSSLRGPQTPGKLLEQIVGAVPPVSPSEEDAVEIPDDVASIPNDPHGESLAKARAEYNDDDGGFNAPNCEEDRNDEDNSSDSTDIDSEHDDDLDGMLF